MNEDTKGKAKKYQLASGHRLHLRGFPFELTNELLQGPAADLHIRHIQNWEAENNVQVIGKMIVLK